MLRIVVKNGLKVVNTIDGAYHVDWNNFRVSEVNRLIECEKILEQFFGLRFHIEEIRENQP